MAFNSALKSCKALALLSTKIEILHIQRLRTIFSAYSRLPRFRTIYALPRQWNPYIPHRLIEFPIELKISI